MEFKIILFHLIKSHPPFFLSRFPLFLVLVCFSQCIHTTMKKRDSLFGLLLSLMYVLFYQPTLAAIPTSSHTLTPTAATSVLPVASASAAKPSYNIGILFPNATDVRSNDPALNNMILTSELTIQLAQKHIQDQNYLPGKVPHAPPPTDIFA
jgi:hypothetical protein